MSDPLVEDVVTRVILRDLRLPIDIEGETFFDKVERINTQLVQIWPLLKVYNESLGDMPEGTGYEKTAQTLCEKVLAVARRGLHLPLIEDELLHEKFDRIRARIDEIWYALDKHISGVHG